LNVPEVTLPSRKRLCIALGPRYEVGESSAAAAARPTGGFRADYGFVATLDCEIRRDPKREVDRRDHAQTAKLMEIEARLSRQAWVQFMNAIDLAHSEIMTLRTQKMTPKRTTRSTPATTTTITTTSVIDAADRSQNGEDSHDSGMGVRRQAPPARDALTWWNSYVTTFGPDVTYAMTWTNLRKKMTNKYCPRGEIKKLKGELWNLRVKIKDMVGYN
nr:reverse transcriptase domain-containing protein [Tanacetum cinerariifolium]